MVNTFFLAPLPYQQSAALLDRARLGKQRVEAYQILLLLGDLRFLGPIFKCGEMPFDKEEEIRDLDLQISNFCRRNLWASEVVSRFRNFTRTTSWGLCRRLENGKYRRIKLGFSSHPALRMWLGYEESLKMYINAHIEEWVKRGYKNTMLTYIIEPLSVVHPWWTQISQVRHSHCASLLRKEKERHEKPHYWLKKEIYSIPQKVKTQGYFWPSKLTKYQILEAIEEGEKEIKN